MSRFIRAINGPDSLPAVPSKLDVLLGLSMSLTQSLEVSFKSMRPTEFSSGLRFDKAEDETDAGGLLDIGEVASRSGMAPSALRYYEREGFIASVDRKGLRRQFRPDVLTTLAVVAMCRQAGFTLEEIKLVLATGGGPSWKAFAEQKRDELRGQAAHLGSMADQLDHALRCPSPNVFDCKHFRASLAQALPVHGDGDRPTAPRGVNGR
jgi:DNA-binding transcriptional MerR regulator